MQHNKDLKAEFAKPANQGDPFEISGAPDVRMRDRGIPKWAFPLSMFFSFGISACMIGLSVMAVFLHSLAARPGEDLLAPILAAVAVVPALGVLVLEYTHAKSLAGYRYARERSSVIARAVTAGVVFLVLEFLHPLLGLAIPLGALLAWAATAGFYRFSKPESPWDFLPEEAVSILSGRDESGRRMARDRRRDIGLLRSFLTAITWFSMVIAMTVASWLTAQEVLSNAAIAAVGLIVFWSVGAFAAFAEQRFAGDPLLTAQAASVTSMPARDNDDEMEDTTGLIVRGLTVKTADGEALLSDISFQAAPGSVIGIAGGPGAGKSLLMQALANPYDMAGLHIEGRVAYHGAELWSRSTAEQSIPALYLPPQPLLVPASGLDNLTCFQSGLIEERSRRVLEQLVFAADAVDEIVEKPDARQLSTTEQKALAFARGFILSPGIFLIDRPEDGTSEKLISAVSRRIQQERRAGRCFLLITENRLLLEQCDKLLMLQGGRMVDFGAAQEIRERQSSGWARFVGARALETEENLESWIRSHFRRDGDDANRRNACSVAAELLAFSCQSTTMGIGQSVTFEFKHFEGYCLIKMTDLDVPVSTGQLQRAQEEAEATGTNWRISPLAAVMRACVSVDASIEMDHRTILAKLETYDPRKNAKEAGPDVANQT